MFGRLEMLPLHILNVTLITSAKRFKQSRMHEIYVEINLAQAYASSRVLTQTHLGGRARVCVWCGVV